MQMLKTRSKTGIMLNVSSDIISKLVTCKIRLQAAIPFPPTNAWL